LGNSLAHRSYKLGDKVLACYYVDKKVDRGCGGYKNKWFKGDLLSPFIPPRSLA
jgi:hypothetical protein